VNVLPQTIRGKLAAAFAVIVITTVIVGFVVQSSYDVIDEKIAIITDKSVPSVVAAQRVAAITGQIAASAPALQGADSEAALIVLLEDLDAQLIQLETEVDNLSRLRGEEESVRKLAKLADEVASKLTEQTRFVRARLALMEQSRTMVDTLAHEHIRFNAVIEPQVEVEKRAIRSATLEVAESSRESVRRLNQLTMKGLLPALLIRVHASNMARIIIAAGSAATEEDVHALWQSFVSENSGAYIQIDELRQNEVLADVLDVEPAEQVLRELTELGSVKGNVFDRRREELAAFSAGVEPPPKGYTVSQIEERLASLAAELDRATDPMIMMVRGRSATAGLDLDRYVSSTLNAIATENLNDVIDLLRLDALGNRIAGVLNAAVSLETEHQLGVSQSRFVWSADELEDVLNTFRDRRTMLSVVESAKHLISFGTGEENVFDLRMAELQMIAQGRSVLDESLSLMEELTGTAGDIVAATRADGARAAAGATRSMGASWIALMGSGAAIVVVMIVVWIYSQRSLGARLSALSRGMLAIAGGNLKAATPAPGNDEIGRMAEALAIFRDTAVEVEEKNLREIAEARQRLVDALESTSEGFAFYDAEDRLVLSNSRYRSLLYPDGDTRLEPGMKFEDVIRQALTKGLIPGQGRDIESTVRERVERHRDPGEPFLQRRADGRWVQISERKTEDGGTVAVYTDLTELKNNEEALAAAKDDAERALQELQLAQRTLVQTEKMASLGQLTAGIAHEIKNPLNFINNFAKSSNELLDELAEEIKPVTGQLDDDARENVDDLLATIKEDLGTIREHGERADSIVKGMLLHSRGGSSTPQQTELNALISESVNLAYHGQRASTPGFNVTLDVDLDDGVGNLELIGQEITRVLVNLLNNAFYAVHARQESGQAGYEPTVSVSSRMLEGDRAEIRIRDNGTGIPADALERLFTPFFTTKPAGEGTGLGLSITHDIVTDQHGGSIRAESEEGAYTEFIIELPRRLPHATTASA
jgi:signal transduction histidine kinase/HAMP domain-containing protein